MTKAWQRVLPRALGALGATTWCFQALGSGGSIPWIEARPEPPMAQSTYTNASPVAQIVNKRARPLWGIWPRPIIKSSAIDENT